MNCSFHRSLFPDREVVESERFRGLSHSVRSRVNLRVGWQSWANAGARSMNEIFRRTSASEAGSRLSSVQLTSLDRICNAYQD